MTQGRLSGTTAIITGGARGQGAAEVRAFVAEGATVVFGDVLHEAGRALAEELGDAATYLPLDVTDESAWAAAVDTARSTYGALTALVNNAGITTMPAPWYQTSVELYRRVIEVNQIACFTGIHHCAPVIAEAGGGSIVNISSVNGFVGARGIPAYVSSKFAIRGLTKCAAIEWGRRNIRVNSVHPGPIDTDMIREGVPGDFDVTEVLGRAVPLGRVGRPDEVAELVVWLTSDASSYCTGAEFIIDGGYLAGPIGIPGN